MSESSGRLRAYPGHLVRVIRPAASLSELMHTIEAPRVVSGAMTPRSCPSRSRWQGTGSHRPRHYAATARAHTHTHTHTSCSRPGQRAGPGTTGPPRPTRAKARAHAHTHTHTHEVQGQKAGPPSESLATIRVTNRYQHGGEEGSAGTNGHVTVCSLSRSTLFRATGQHTGPRFVNPCTYKAAAAL